MKVITASILICIAYCSGTWFEDNEYAVVNNVDCDFDVKSDDSELDMTKPFVIRNAALHWDAANSLDLDMMLSKYGDRIVSTGSESSIVYSGGISQLETTLKDLIVEYQQSRKDDKIPNKFVFDTTILDNIPELNNDIVIPSKIAGWDTEDNRETGDAWRMLSIGASRSGLPFHSHGETWIAIVHGAKRWFVYPPGLQLPSYANYPLLPPNQWLTETYNNWKHLPKPITSNNRIHYSPTIDYQPLQCITYANDILYLPSRWLHMTLNIGDTIAIGGQRNLPDDRRFIEAEEILLQYPNNSDANRDVGLAIANIVTTNTNMPLLALSKILDIRVCMICDCNEVRNDCLYNQSIEYLSKALESNPQNPETLSMLIEVFGIAAQDSDNENGTMKDQIMKYIMIAEEQYEKIYCKYHISNITMASLYYRIGNILLANKLYADALKYNGKSLQFYPKFPLALVDKAKILMKLTNNHNDKIKDNKQSIIEVLNQVKCIAPSLYDQKYDEFQDILDEKHDISESADDNDIDIEDIFQSTCSNSINYTVE